MSSQKSDGCIRRWGDTCTCAHGSEPPRPMMFSNSRFDKSGLRAPLPSLHTAAEHCADTAGSTVQSRSRLPRCQRRRRYLSSELRDDGGDFLCLYQKHRLSGLYFKKLWMKTRANAEPTSPRSWSTFGASGCGSNGALVRALPCLVTAQTVFQCPSETTSTTPSTTLMAV